MICKGCSKRPHELEEFREMADIFEMTAEAYIEAHEETFEAQTRRFFCTDCWLKAGMPVRTTEGVRLLAGKPVYRS